uniref:Uncharacterized protein n=1 Tax=Panagrellus redivivus TaxID=6233 RepID=A0A7E4ZRH5_PANRE
MATISSNTQQPNFQPKRLSKLKDSPYTPNKKKRSVEPRPHPPACLNKRYWDNVRAGRISDPSKKACIQSKKITKPIVPQPLESKVPQAEDLLPLLQPISNSVSNASISPFPNLIPGPFPSQVMPIMNYFGPLPPLLSSPSLRFGIPSVSSTDVITQRQPLEKSIHRKFPIEDVVSRPTTCSQSTSDDEVDRIADEMITKIDRTSDHNLSKTSLCIIPFPVPIPIVLPLTVDFVYAHFGLRVCKK